MYALLLGPGKDVFTRGYFGSSGNLFSCAENIGLATAAVAGTAAR